MNDLLSAFLLGILEGLTEFLPISSTGHLLIAQHWLGERSDLFNIAIQAGAILAVTLVYRQRLAELLTGWREAANRDYLIKLVSAFTFTAVLGLGAKLAGVKLPETVAPVAAALILGGLLILVFEAWAKRQAEVATVSWLCVMAVGCAQVVAGVFPGTSRSASAIFAAMFAGLTARKKAAEFAFLVGIPTMFAATGFELLKTILNGSAAGEAWGELGLAFLTSSIVGFAAVRWLLSYIASHTYTVFAYYRIALGVVLILAVEA